jgi:hypothetical protein
MSSRQCLIAMAITLGACGTLHAADFPVNYAVPDARLDAIRGGFDVGALKVSLGLERTVLVNGVEAIRQSINIPDVAQMSVDQANALRAALTTTVVTNGAGGVTTDSLATGAQSVPAISTATPAAASNSSTSSQSVALQSTQSVVTLPAGTSPSLVVQNALDNQAITATTKIDASVNTSQMLQNMRIDESIKDAVIQFRGN